MKMTTQTNLDKFFEYIEFINVCSKKEYSNELVTHEHHVIPRFIDDTKIRINDTVKLSVDDHIKAHHLLSECFDEGSKEQIGNLRSVKLLSKNSIKYKDELDKIYEHQRGEGHPSKKLENRIKISQGLKKYYKDGGVNYKKGKTYEEIYGKEGAELQRKKRAKCTRTKEQYKESAEKTSKKLKGRKTHNAESVTIEGVTYLSKTDACKALNTYYLKLNKYLNGKKVSF